jgi:hypothetical protein
MAAGDQLRAAGPQAALFPDMMALWWPFMLSMMMFEPT